MYSKISTNSKDVFLDDKKISINLLDNEQIMDIKVIDENRLLIIIQSSNNIKGAIFNIDKDKISKFIEK